MPHQDDARQLREGLDHVEVAERADLEEGHAVLLGVGPGLLCGNLPLEGQVQPVPDQDPRHARCMLGTKRSRSVRGFGVNSASCRSETQDCISFEGFHNLTSEPFCSKVSQSKEAK